MPSEDYEPKKRQTQGTPSPSPDRGTRSRLGHDACERDTRTLGNPGPETCLLSCSKTKNMYPNMGRFAKGMSCVYLLRGQRLSYGLRHPLSRSTENETYLPMDGQEKILIMWQSFWNQMPNGELVKSTRQPQALENYPSSSMRTILESTVDSKSTYA